MGSGFWGESVDTAALILLGNGVVACVALDKSFGHGGGWIVITAGWCFAVMAGVLTALALGAPAYLNPAAAKRACFCTAPATENLPASLLSAIIVTFVLVLVVAAIGSARLTLPSLAAGLGPVAVAFLVWALGLSLGGPTGYAINPVRDLGPRIMHAVLPIADKGSSEWGCAPVPVIGPVIGATLAGLCLHLMSI